MKVKFASGWPTGNFLLFCTGPAPILGDFGSRFRSRVRATSDDTVLYRMISNDFIIRYSTVSIQYSIPVGRYVPYLPTHLPPSYSIERGEDHGE